MMGHTGLDKSRAPLIRSSFFLYAKIAGARKSSPAKGKEKGCGCEGGLAHKNTSHGMIVAIIILFFTKCNCHFSQFKAKELLGAAQWGQTSSGVRRFARGVWQ